MSECEFCGAPDPKWIRHVDGSMADYMRRVGLQASTAKPVCFCDRAECKFAMVERYGPEGNAAALERLIREIPPGPEHENERRAAQLMVDLL